MKSFLGGAGAAALCSGLLALVQWWLNRLAQRQDQAQQRRTADCAARGREIEDLHRMMQALMTSERAILYDRIKYLAKTYLKKGWISVEEYEDLRRMHSVYHEELQGNGFLDTIMEEVSALEKRVYS